MTDVDLSFEVKPVVRILRDLAEARPDAPAVTCESETMTRQQLESASNRMARAYSALGVRFGDFVTIGLVNSIEFYVSMVATWKLGAVPQPVSNRLPVIERQAIVELADSALVIGVRAEDHPGRPTVPAGFAPDPVTDDSPLPEVVSPAMRAPTSGGSTGRPKLIVFGSRAESPAAAGVMFGMEPEDVHLVPGPLYHNSPLSLSSTGLLMGHHLVILPRFDAVAALEAIGKYGVNWVNLVPTMMSRMLRAIHAEPDRFDLSSLRVVWHMAAPCADWLKQAWIDLIGPEKLFELYGGTEVISFTAISGTDWLAHRGSVGKPVMGEMVILGPSGERVAAGEVGEIFMRRTAGTPPTYRYIGAESRQVDGWESLGDMGWIDEEGFVYLNDRRTDMILSGGANIYPSEVEGALDAHPEVLSSVVVGLPDDDLGQKVHALVQTRRNVSREEILEHLSSRLVRYKVPRSIEFIDEPLRDDAGKVRRSAMRDSAVLRQSGAKAGVDLSSVAVTAAAELAAGFAATECPRWHDGRLFFSDMHGHAVFALTPGSAPEKIADVHGPGGIGWLPDGRLLVVSQRDRQILRLDPGGLVVHADLSASVQSWLNDLWVDPAGHAYVGEMGFDIHAFGRGEEVQIAPANLWRVDPDGSHQVAARDVFFPNGIVASADGRTLIVAESFRLAVTAFDIADDGTLGDRRLWAQLKFAPDGITLDRDGALWVADPVGKRALRVAEGGEILGAITVDRTCLSCALGGIDGRTLYICTTGHTEPDEAIEHLSSRIDSAPVEVGSAYRHRSPGGR
jgi:bile acid-coenzyme A ligase